VDVALGGRDFLEDLFVAILIGLVAIGGAAVDDEC